MSEVNGTACDEWCVHINHLRGNVAVDEKVVSDRRLFAGVLKRMCASIKKKKPDVQNFILNAGIMLISFLLLLPLSLTLSHTFLKKKRPERQVAEGDVLVVDAEHVGDGARGPCQVVVADHHSL